MILSKARGNYYVEDKRFAMLIDSDNISSKYISAIIDEMTKYGTVTYKRIYGDWTTPQSAKWKDELITNSITPVQQFRNTVGKNATDSTLIIEAMDILYTGNVDGFCIVSSDSDFTRLAGRLRESGMDVIGMGENKTHRSFRAACSVFTSLEILIEQAEDEEEEVKEEKIPHVIEEEEALVEKSSQVLLQSVVINAISQIISENDDKGRNTELGEIGGRLQKKHSDFDVRNYGYSSLSQFIADCDEFELNKINTKCLVKIKDKDTFKKAVTAFIIQCVADAGRSGIDLGVVGQRVHQRYPTFTVKTFGYSTLSKFVSVIDHIQISETAGRKHLNLV